MRGIAAWKTARVIAILVALKKSIFFNINPLETETAKVSKDKPIAMRMIVSNSIKIFGKGCKSKESYGKTIILEKVSLNLSIVLISPVTTMPFIQKNKRNFNILNP
jgi:hypothetical protein